MQVWLKFLFAGSFFVLAGCASYTQGKKQSLSVKNWDRVFWKSKPSAQVAHSVSLVFAASASTQTIPGFAALRNLPAWLVTTGRADDPRVAFKRSLSRWRMTI